MSNEYGVDEDDKIIGDDVKSATPFNINDALETANKEETEDLQEDLEIAKKIAEKDPIPDKLQRVARMCSRIKRNQQRYRHIRRIRNIVKEGDLDLLMAAIKDASITALATVAALTQSHDENVALKASIWILDMAAFDMIKNNAQKPIDVPNSADVLRKARERVVARLRDKNTDSK